MSWRNRPPKITDYETIEEYDEAVEAFYDAIEACYEERLLNKEDKEWNMNGRQC